MLSAPKVCLVFVVDASYSLASHLGRLITRGQLPFLVLLFVKDVCPGNSSCSPLLPSAALGEVAGQLPTTGSL